MLEAIQENGVTFLKP